MPGGSPFASRLPRTVPMRRGTFCDVPLPSDALSRLREPPGVRNPLCPALVPDAQRIAGTIGFITNMVRPDAHFGYCVIARYLSEERLTRLAFEYLIRVGSYLVATKHLCLTLTVPEVTPAGLDLFSVYADSSHGNAEDGLSHGSFVLLSNGQDGRSGGAFAWKCETPPEGDDSSGAAELRMVTRAVKYTIAARTIQRDLALGIAPSAPTVVYTDASAVLGGQSGDHMAKSSRWMATRRSGARRCGWRSGIRPSTAGTS